MTARRHDVDAPTRVADPDEIAEAGAEAPPASRPGFPYAVDEIVAGKYILLELLGQGGMGSVWRALNSQLETEVAIKLLRGDAVSIESRTRLEQEARVSARIDHPAVVRVFDLGRSERGDPFIVMELLRGKPLSALIAQGAIEPRRAVALLLPVAAALVRAHGLGVVHRDLKPDNVFLVDGEAGLVQPKVVDFGIARLNDPESSGARVTRAGVLVGSPGYMAPEQARGSPDVDERADVWALAVLLYEAISGRECFQGDNTLALLSAVLEREPPTFAELGVGDDELWDIVNGGLAKKREERTPTVREIGRRLAEWALAQGLEEDAAGVSIRRTWLDDPSRASLEPGRSSGLPSQSRLAAASRASASASAAGQAGQAGQAAAPIVVGPGVSPASDRNATSTTLTTPSGPQPVPPGLASPSPKRWPVALVVGVAAASAGLWLARGADHHVPASAALSLTPPSAAPSPSAPSPTPKLSASPAASSAEGPSTAEAPSSSASAASSASSASAASSAPQASFSPPPKVAPGGEMACMAGVFPAGTFARNAKLGAVCTEHDAKKAAEALKTEIIRGGGVGHKATEAMKEWAVLGFYEMAATAALRGRCCPAAKPMYTLPTPGRCERPDKVLNELTHAIAQGRDAESLLARYLTAGSCVINSGAGKRFGLAPPKGGERAALDKFVARLR